jgi:hypothetical protein
LAVCSPLGAARALEASLPETVSALPASEASRPFLAAAHQIRPLDLAAHGYVEEEFLLRGRARVFDWPERMGTEPPVLGQGDYTTRILVRRPVADERFSGAVVVEAFNPSSPVDLPIMWAESHEYFIREGMAWVGVTVKPNTIVALKRFDPQRYGRLAMSHPPAGPACSADEINPWSQPTAPADETGLTWDLLSQLGLALKSQGSSNPLGRTAERVYLTGQSQTAGYARTYASVFSRVVTAVDGGRIFDGYLYSGSPPWQVPLHQCAASFAPGDPRLITAAAGVPVIEIFAEGDLGTNIETRRADSDPLPDLYRRYEVAGAAHTDAWERLSFPSDADMTRATEQSEALPDVECMPDDVEPSDFPVRYAFNAAWSHLERWVRDGVPAPAAERLALKDDIPTPFAPASAFVVDRRGNATGGLRTPVIDVPTARWVGAKTGGFQCMFEGYKRSFTRAELEALYGTREAYLERVRSSASALRAERWLTPTDAAEIVRLAERSEVLR